MGPGLNGFIAPQKGSSGPISGVVAREVMHRIRALCKAVLATPVRLRQIGQCLLQDLVNKNLKSFMMVLLLWKL